MCFNWCPFSFQFLPGGGNLKQKNIDGSLIADKNDDDEQSEGSDDDNDESEEEDEDEGEEENDETVGSDDDETEWDG